MNKIYKIFFFIFVFLIYQAFYKEKSLYINSTPDNKDILIQECTRSQFSLALIRAEKHAEEDGKEFNSQEFKRKFKENCLEKKIYLKKCIDLNGDQQKCEEEMNEKFNDKVSSVSLNF